MSVKRVFLVIAAGMLCNACATYQSVVYRSDTYANNKSVYGYLKQGKEDVKYSDAGAYDLYFAQQNNTYPSYQMVYHYVGNYEPEYDYYVVLVRLNQYAPVQTAKAVYNGVELPVAVKSEEQKSVVKSQLLEDLANAKLTVNYVNILLTRDQLIGAYENAKNTGKMIIQLTVDGQTYQIVFPDTYLRNVLATTTNITKYKMEEKVVGSLAPDPASLATAQRTELFTYGATFQEPYWYRYGSRNTKGEEERISFDLKIANKQHNLKFDITYILQRVNIANPDNHTHDFYVKAIEVKENAESGRSCKKIKAEVGADQVMFWIECDGEYGTNYYLYLKDTPTVGSCSGCSVVKHL